MICLSIPAGLFSYLAGCVVLGFDSLKLGLIVIYGSDLKSIRCSFLGLMICLCIIVSSWFRSSSLLLFFCCCLLIGLRSTPDVCWSLQEEPIFSLVWLWLYEQGQVVVLPDNLVQALDLATVLSLSLSLFFSLQSSAWFDYKVFAFTAPVTVNLKK